MNRESERKRLVEILDKTIAYKDENTDDYIEWLADVLLANGIVVPPCKVGDSVYWIDDGKIKNEEVFKISIHSDGILVHTGIQFCLGQVFLTRAEAEKALEGSGEK